MLRTLQRVAAAVEDPAQPAAEAVPRMITDGVVFMISHDRERVTVVFNGDSAGSLVAHDAATGDLLWHTRIGDVSNAPQTFLLDGHQYIIAATGQTLWAFLLY